MSKISDADKRNLHRQATVVRIYVSLKLKISPNVKYRFAVGSSGRNSNVSEWPFLQFSPKNLIETLRWKMI